jgi:hypothetical protein
MIYAEDIDGNSIHIDDAVKGITYYFRYEDKEYEIIVAHGKKYIKHYKTKRGEDINVNIIFHKDCQKYIKESKVVEVENLIITCDKVLLEAEAARYIKAKIPDYSMRPDCLFLDSDGEIMCIVEVNVTHAKSDEDIEKIKQYKIITIELTYGKRKDNYKQPEATEWLYQSEITPQIRDCHRRIKIGQVELQKLYAAKDPQINELERQIRELEREIKEEEELNTAFNKYIARLQSENYKKRLENE